MSDASPSDDERAALIADLVRSVFGVPTTYANPIDMADMRKVLGDAYDAGLRRQRPRLDMSNPVDPSCKDEGVAPDKPKTPISNFRIPPEVKAKAMERAESEDKTLTYVVTQLLDRYGRGQINVR
ncbi:hypothetical protein J2Y46_002579 [Microbacterium sp. BE35]|uniref:hypothetical protein n=1 Tax=Microbacterium sp. BE35 TaxID=2817773 RepID=UPI0028575A29|nr:hypothetical protein [Microbacterium sp. BE35]MDR7189753.1 hypothetical protein [Microbacterium sp. BE35]